MLHLTSEGIYQPPGVVWITIMKDGCAFWNFKAL